MSRKIGFETRAARAFGLKNYALAIRHLTDLLECVGENPHTLHMLALCHFRHNDDLEAHAFARRALQADDRHLESLKLLAQLHVLRGEHAEARRLVARALEQGHAPGSDPTGSKNWLSAILARLRARRDHSHRAGVADGNEHRLWIEWARAYIAAPQESDGEASR